MSFLGNLEFKLNSKRIQTNSKLNSKKHNKLARFPKNAIEFKFYNKCKAQMHVFEGFLRGVRLCGFCENLDSILNSN